MLVFSGATRVEQVVGIVDPRPHPVRVVNQGETPIVVLDITLDADWVTYSLVTPDEARAATVEADEAAGAGRAAAPKDLGRQLWQLQWQNEHAIEPGAENAWLLNLYWDATHPDAQAGRVHLHLLVNDGTSDETITRELTFQASLQHLPVFEGLLALDWGDANLRGAYIAREAFNPKPVPVLVGGGRGADPFSRPTRDLEDATEEDARRRKASSRMGTRASLYLDNVQDKFAPVVSVDEAAEITALSDGPSHLPNLVRNLKRTLGTLPPYGGLTLAYLEDQPTVVEDRFSANTFRTQSYDLAQLARLLIETTVNSLARQPRKIWDEDGEKTFTLPSALGIINEIVLTYPPLMPAPVRRALRQWFRDGGVVPGATREWDEITARVLHACLGYLHERGGKVETFIRRFGTIAHFLVVDAGATGTRLARVRLELDLGETDDDSTVTGNGNGNGKKKEFRPVTMRVVHDAVCHSQSLTGEHILLSVFRLLKLKLAALVASKLMDTKAEGHANARAAARDLTSSIQAGRIADLLRQPIEALPAAVEQLVPTRFRESLEEAPRRHFTMLTLLASRVLEALGEGLGTWTPTTPGSGPSLSPLLAEVLTQSWPEIHFDEDDWASLTISEDELAAQVRPAVDALARAVRRLREMPVRHSTSTTADEPHHKPAAPRGITGTRSSFAKGWGGGAPPGTGARPLPLGSRGASNVHADEVAEEAPPADPWLLLGGGALVPAVIRRMVSRALTLRDDAGAGHEAPKMWPDADTHEADAATAIALGACEAERAVQAGLKIDIVDSLDQLQFDLGIRTDRFIPLLERGTSVRHASSVLLPTEPSTPLVIWYRFLDGVEPAAPLGTFENAPPGDGPLCLSLVPHGDGAWTLELTRNTPYDTQDPARTPSVSLTPAPPMTPLEFNLYSGIH